MAFFGQWRVRDIIFGALSTAALAQLVVLGCIGRNGDTRLASQTYRSDDRTFGLEYISPPWRLDSDGASAVQLSVPAEIFGVTLEGSPPSHVMIAGLADLAESLDQLLDLDNDALEELEDLIGSTTGWSGATAWTGWTSTSWPGGTGSGDAGGLPDLPEIPEYLIDVNLTNSRDVAFAEMSFLIEEKDARVASGLQKFVNNAGQAGVVYEVVLDPGVFVRSFYFRTSKTALKVVFISLFELETIDLDLMAATIYTDGPREP
ncbi:MAG: hypothetical protein V3V08_12565 [Nannocystaceae bacterium]